MLEDLFAFLFKYRLLVFERGELAFGAPWPMLLGVVVVVAAVLPIVTYARSRNGLERRDRVLLGALRGAALAVLTFILLRPVLVIATVVPQENFLGILVDDSRSMQIADADGATRGAAVAGLLDPVGGRLAPALADRFKLRLFRFDRATARIEDPASLAYLGSGTALGQALDYVRQELSAVPLAGIVVLSDGADNTGGGVTGALLRLKAAALPVYTVGLGTERFAKDIQLGRVEAPQRVLQGSALVLDLLVTHRGYGGETVHVQVEDEGRIVGTQDVRLPRDGEAATVSVQFIAREPGSRLFRFRIPPRPDETVPQNNTRDVLITVERAPRKILYFEGEPRFEVKFLRRAVDGDPNLRVVTFVRQAENNFRRLDVEHADELAAGFPRSREELFQYHGLILGSVEAGFFTRDQLRMIAEFVGQRGGGLLVLGGRNAFAAGGYAGTALEDVLPVVLPVTPQDSAPLEIRIEPTPQGRTHPAVQIDSSLEASAARWDSLPPLTSLHAIRDVKPGATTLLTGDVAGDGERIVVLAHQRYGRGRSVAFVPQDLWLWQMHADIPLDDLTHETLWRQLLRWLVSGVPDRITVTPSRDRAAVGERVTVTAEVTDSAFLAVNGADVAGVITTPGGAEREVRLDWVVDRDGAYTASLPVDERGPFTIRVDARRGDVELGSGAAHFRGAEPVEEYFDAEMHAGLLGRLAGETAGRFYTLDEVDRLPDDVRYTESGITVRDTRDLWDMPILFLALITLVAAEWGYRRLRGLV